MTPMPRTLGHDIALIVLFSALWGLATNALPPGDPRSITLLHLAVFGHLWFTVLLGLITGPRIWVWIGLILMLMLDKTIGPSGFFPTATMFGAPLDSGLAPLNGLLTSAPIEWLTGQTTRLLAVLLIVDIGLMQWATLQHATRQRLMWLGVAITVLILLPAVLWPLRPPPSIDTDQAFQSVEEIMEDLQTNPLVIPINIVPESYVLPDYTILRAIPSKAGGLIGMIAAMLSPLLVIAFRGDRLTSGRSRAIWLLACLAFLPLVVTLAYAGAYPADGGWLITARILTVLYFGYFLTMPTLRRVLEGLD